MIIYIFLLVKVKWNNNVKKERFFYRNYLVSNICEKQLFQFIIGNKQRLCVSVNMTYLYDRQNSLLITPPSYFIFDKLLSGKRGIRSLLNASNFIDCKEIKGHDTIDEEYIIFNVYNIWSHYFVPFKQDMRDYLIIRHTYFERTRTEIHATYIFNTDNLVSVLRDSDFVLASKIRNVNHDFYLPCQNPVYYPFRLNQVNRSLRKPIKLLRKFTTQIEDGHEVMHHDGIL